MLYTETAALYDLTHESDERPDVRFYVKQCEGVTGQALELACGTGRVLIPIAESGVCITGIDASEPMLDRCKVKLAALHRQVQERITLFRQNMQDLDVSQPIEMAIAPCRGFQHLMTVDDQLACLGRVHDLLPSKGRFILDVFTVNLQAVGDFWSGKEIVGIRDKPISGGKTLTYSFRVTQRHPSLQYNDVEFIYTVTNPDGSTERHVDALPWRYFFRFELEHLLDKAGFRIVAEYGDFDESPLSDESPNMIFLSEKR